MSFVFHLFEQEKLEIAAVENKKIVATLEEVVSEQMQLKECCLLKEVKLFIAKSIIDYRHVNSMYILVGVKFQI